MPNFYNKQLILVVYYKTVSNYFEKLFNNSKYRKRMFFKHMYSSNKRTTCMRKPYHYKQAFTITGMYS